MPKDGKQSCSSVLLTNSIHKESDGRDKEFQFDGYNEEKFQIIGVAIAVFKPLNAPG
jgi:hypothetical protein